MKTIIAGSRSINNYDLIKLAVKNSQFIITEVVSGRAKGVDKLGERWANENKIPIKPFPADWDRLGKAAGYARNKQMAEYAEALIAIWDLKSRGTKHMIDLAREKGLQVSVFTCE